MSERMNIWDILSNKQLNIEQEYVNLWNLVTSNNQVTISQNYRTYSYSLYQVINEHFIEFKHRGTFIKFDEFLNYLELRIPNDYNQLYMEVTLDTLDLVIEIILLVFSELDDLDYGYHYEDIKNSIYQNIELILQKSNQKLIEIEKGKLIIVPNDETVTAVSELILPDDEKLALSILGYSHYANKDNIESKRHILLKLSNYIEPKLKKKKDSDISFVLNKYLIRHGDKENQENVKNLGNENLNQLYDGLYRDILFYLLGQEHENFSSTVKQLKESMSGK